MRPTHKEAGEDWTSSKADQLSFDEAGFDPIGEKYQAMAK